MDDRRCTEMALKAAAGDRSEFELLVNECYDWIRRVCFKRLFYMHYGSYNHDTQEDSWELTHEILIKLAGKIATFRGESKRSEKVKFTTWLYKVVENEVYDFVKKRNRANRGTYRTIKSETSSEGERKEYYAKESLDEEVLRNTAGNYNFNDEHSRVEFWETLRKAMSKELTERQYELFFEVAIMERTFVEVAEKLGLAESTVVEHVTKAKKKLKEIL